jgi:hypothetical protein
MPGFEFSRHPDIQGATLKQATLTLQPGTGGFLDFASDRPSLVPQRAEINPFFTVLRGGAGGGRGEVALESEMRRRLRSYF